jgi:hypothetical protein
MDPVRRVLVSIVVAAANQRGRLGRGRQDNTRFLGFVPQSSFSRRRFPFNTTHNGQGHLVLFLFSTRQSLVLLVQVIALLHAHHARQTQVSHLLDRVVPIQQRVVTAIAAFTRFRIIGPWPFGFFLGTFGFAGNGKGSSAGYDLDFWSTSFECGNCCGFLVCRACRRRRPNCRLDHHRPLSTTPNQQGTLDAEEYTTLWIQILEWVVRTVKN